MLDLSSIVRQSHIRCRTATMDPSHMPQLFHTLPQAQLQIKQQEYHTMIAATPYIMEKMLPFIHDQYAMIIITDHAGYVIEIQGNTQLTELMENLNIVKGTQMAEEIVGTNAIHLCLEQRRPVRLVGEEHYCEKFHNLACYAVPFSYPNKGVVSVVVSKDHHEPYMLPLLTGAVQSLEEALNTSKQSKLLHLTMMNTVKDAFAITNQWGNIINANHFFMELFSLSQEAIKRKLITQIPLVGEYFEQVLKKGRVYEEIEITFLHEKKGQMTVLMDAFPVHDESQNLFGVYAQFRNITEYRLMENKLQLAERFSLAGKLSATLAHQIRNPLASSLGYTQLLMQKLQGEEEGKYLDLIYEQLMGINTMISEFAKLSKLNSPVCAEISLNQLLQESIEIVYSQATLKNITIQLHLPYPSLKVWIDYEQMKQTFLNILQNAIEAIEHQEGKIDIEVQVHSDQVIIDFIDNGKGVPDRITQSVFDPFFTTKDYGMGLGLSICKRIIESHYGQIYFKKEHGKTVLSVMLPHLAKA